MQGKTLTQFNYDELFFPMITVYDHPIDYPNHYVARVWDSSVPLETTYFVLYDSLEECRRDIEKAGFLIPIPRSPQDDLCIVESHIR